MSVNPSTFDTRVAALLIEGGWYEGRDVSLKLSWPQGHSLLPEAISLLSEFGNIHVVPGEYDGAVVTSDISFDLNAQGYFCGRLLRLEKNLDVTLSILGFIDNQHALLVIDSLSRIYYFSMMGNELFPIAASFAEGLNYLLLGNRMTRSGIDTVWLASGTKLKNKKRAFIISLNMWGVPIIDEVGNSVSETDPTFPVPTPGS